MNLYFSFGVILLGQFIAKLNRVIFSTTAFFIALVLQNNLNCLVPSSGFRVFVHFISVSVSFVCLDQVRAFKYAFTAHSCCCVFFQIVRDLRAQYCLSFHCLVSNIHTTKIKSNQVTSSMYLFFSLLLFFIVIYLTHGFRYSVAPFCFHFTFIYRLLLIHDC